jgi:hypothetical protein
MTIDVESGKIQALVIRIDFKDLDSTFFSATIALAKTYD